MDGQRNTPNLTSGVSGADLKETMPTNLNPWNYKYIRQLVAEASELAKEQGLRPSLATEVVKTYAHSHRLNIPFLGDYLPEGWIRMYDFEPIFVDITGRGQPGDPAITAFEFYRRAQQHTKSESSVVLAYGVIEQGQTQALVAAYRKETNGTKSKT